MNFMKELNSLILVFIGGGIGASFRYLISLFIKNQSLGFPFSTFWVNIIGCFAIGILYSLLSYENQPLKLLFIVGLIGGFTTFSSFGYETINLYKNGQLQTALIYVILSNICGLVAVYLGVKISSLIS